MAAELVTPVDELSGLPLPIAPNEQLSRLVHTREVNWHHHFHPELDPKLTGSLGGLALRHCRKQLVVAKRHNMSKASYHNIFIGPPIPEDENEQFSQVVLACAGLIPRQVIEIDLDGYNIVELNHNKQDIIQKKKKKSKNEYMYFRYGYEPVRDFMKEHAISVGIQSISELQIEEFLSPTIKKIERIKIGREMLQKMAQVACSSVDDKYKIFRQAGLLHPDMPEDSFTLVEATIGDVAQKEHLLKEISDKAHEYINGNLAA